VVSRQDVAALRDKSATARHVAEVHGQDDPLRPGRFAVHRVSETPHWASFDADADFAGRSGGASTGAGPLSGARANNLPTIPCNYV
jgi:hypothetical protein